MARILQIQKYESFFCAFQKFLDLKFLEPTVKYLQFIKCIFQVVQKISSGFGNNQEVLDGPFYHNLCLR